MWKRGSLLFAGILLSGCAVDLTNAETEKPAEVVASGASLALAPEVVEYKRKVKVTISGSGFKPGQELALLVDIGGAPSDISGLVKPKPVTNEKGEFSSVWVIDDEIRTKLLAPTSHTIEVVDEEWRTLAQATLTFKAPEKKGEKK